MSKNINAVAANINNYMQNELKEKLIETANEISSYPDHRFESTCINVEEIKQSYYPNGEVTIPELREARNDLKTLKSGGVVFAEGF